MSADLRHEIKEILKEGTFWCQTGDLDLTVEKLHSVMDREGIKRELKNKDFQAELRFPVTLRILPNEE